MKKLISIFAIIFLSIGSFMSGANAQANNQNYPLGSPEQGHNMLEDFIVSGQGLADFILTLKPTKEDIKAVYKEPLASNLIVIYEELYGSLSGLSLKPEQNSVLSVFSTTAKLAQGDAILGEFPGGYKRVGEYFLGDYPIAIFKFVKMGETRGLSFNGLIFINDRWVLMPKPWRGINNNG